MLRYRLIFGPLMIAAVLLLCWFDNRLDHLDIAGTPLQRLFLGRTYLPAGLLMFLVILVIIPLAARELSRIFVAKGIDTDALLLSLAGMSGLAMTYAIPFRIESQLGTALMATLMIVIFLAALVRYSFPRRRTDGAVAVAAATMFTVVYLGLLPGFLIAIRRWHSAWIVVGVILIAKSCDIGAYFTGRWLGRTKLIEWLSPKKTIEGLAGGVVWSALVAVTLAALGNHLHAIGRWDHLNGSRTFILYPCPLWFAALAGALLGAFGHFGDLIASLFKRDAGLKDSGESIPGFGGVIDVIDSAILVAPLAYWLLLLLTALA